MIGFVRKRYEGNMFAMRWKAKDSWGLERKQSNQTLLPTTCVLYAVERTRSALMALLHHTVQMFWGSEYKYQLYYTSTKSEAGSNYAVPVKCFFQNKSTVPRLARSFSMRVGMSWRLAAVFRLFSICSFSRSMLQWRGCRKYVAATS